jgi:hypothetical protein
LDVCLNRDGGKGATPPDGWRECSMSSVLAIFGYEASRWATAADILTTLSDASRATWNATYVSPDSVVLGQLLGGLKRDAVGAIIDASVLQAS